MIEDLRFHWWVETPEGWYGYSHYNEAPPGAMWYTIPPPWVKKYSERTLWLLGRLGSLGFDR